MIGSIKFVKEWIKGKNVNILVSCIHVLVMGLTLHRSAKKVFKAVIKTPKPSGPQSKVWKFKIELKSKV